MRATYEVGPTLDDAAKTLGVSRPSVQRMIQRGEIPALRTVRGGRVRYILNRAALDVLKGASHGNEE